MKRMRPAPPHCLPLKLTPVPMLLMFLLFQRKKTEPFEEIETRSLQSTGDGLLPLCEQHSEFSS
jgi:hypothetical protein